MTSWMMRRAMRSRRARCAGNTDAAVMAAIPEEVHEADCKASKLSSVRAARVTMCQRLGNGAALQS
jgi:hypothetical protein